MINKLESMRSVYYSEFEYIRTFNYLPNDDLVDANKIAHKIAKDTYYKVQLSKNKKSFWEKLFNKD